MVHLAVRTNGSGNFSGRSDRRSILPVNSSGFVHGHPLMVGVRDDSLAIGEGHLEARPIEHWMGGVQDSRGASGLVEDVIPGVEVSHRAPARWSGYGGVEGQRLSLEA